MADTEQPVAPAAEGQPAERGGSDGGASRPESPAPAAPARPSSDDLIARMEREIESAYSTGSFTGEQDGGDPAPEADAATPVAPADTPSAPDTAEAQPDGQGRKPGSRRERAERARSQGGGTTEASSGTSSEPAGAPDTAAAPSSAPSPDASPQRSREEIIAEWQREQEAKAAAERQAREDRQRFAEWTGDVEVVVDGTPTTRYDRARALAARDAMTVPYEASQEEHEAAARHNAEINAARAELAQYDRARRFLERVAEPVEQAKTQAQQEARSQALAWIGERFERGMADLGVDVAAVIEAGAAVPDPAERVPAIVRALGDAIRKRVVAEYEPKIADLEEDAAAKDSEIAALRRQLGGRAPQPERGGRPASSTRPTIEALDALGKDVTLDDLAPFLEQLPAGGRRR